jgi:hypothetical protein
MRRKITNETWEQIKTGYAAGINLREIARKMDIPEGTVLAHAKRHGWTQQIQAATGKLSVVQSDAITPVQSVPRSLAAIMAERKNRTRLGLSKFAAEAAEQAAEHQDKLGIAGKVKDVASVHKTLWSDETGKQPLLNIALLTGQYQPTEAPKQVEALEVKSSHESIAAKTEKKREVTWESRDRAPALDRVPQPTPAEIAAQVRRQKEADYREKCRNRRCYT